MGERYFFVPAMAFIWCLARVLFVQTETGFGVFYVIVGEPRFSLAVSFARGGSRFIIGLRPVNVLGWSRVCTILHPPEGWKFGVALKDWRGVGAIAG